MEPKKTKKTFVYIDGYNLYYGSLKNTDFKWLNPLNLCKNILSPNNDILKIKYFTAKVSDRRNDPSISTRQNFYFQALRTIPNLEIILGHYLTHPTYMQLANPPLYKRIMTSLSSHRYSEVSKAEVIKTEEKGSDVNLASNLLLDAFSDVFEVAVIISNDSDLALPVELVSKKFKKKIVILNPHKASKRSYELNRYSAKTIEISEEALSNSQFPNPILHQGREIKKPSRW